MKFFIPALCLFPLSGFANFENDFNLSNQANFNVDCEEINPDLWGSIGSILEALPGVGDSVSAVSSIMQIAESVLCLGYDGLGKDIEEITRLTLEKDKVKVVENVIGSFENLLQYDNNVTESEFDSMITAGILLKGDISDVNFPAINVQIATGSFLIAAFLGKFHLVKGNDKVDVAKQMISQIQVLQRLMETQRKRLDTHLGKFKIKYSRKCVPTIECENFEITSYIVDPKGKTVANGGTEICNGVRCTVPSAEQQGKEVLENIRKKARAKVFGAHYRSFLKTMEKTKGFKKSAKNFAPNYWDHNSVYLKNGKPEKIKDNVVALGRCYTDPKCKGVFQVEATYTAGPNSNKYEQGYSYMFRSIQGVKVAPVTAGRVYTKYNH